MDTLMPGQQTASKTEKETVEIKLAHSPDSDDAFMFYALATHKLPTPGYKYTHILSDIQSLNAQDLVGKRVGVPGLKTSAYLTLKLFEPDFEPVVMPFDKIMEAVQNNLVDAGLLIHEGQLFFPARGLHKVVDLGIWWQEQTGLPLPLGGNAVRRALGPQLGR